MEITPSVRMILPDISLGKALNIQNKENNHQRCALNIYAGCQVEDFLFTLHRCFTTEETSCMDVIFDTHSLCNERNRVEFIFPCHK